MKKTTALVLTSCFLLFSYNLSAKDIQSFKLSPGLEKLVSTSPLAGSDSLVNILVILDNSKIQSQVAKTISKNIVSRGERIKAVTNQLKNFRPEGYDEVKKFLNEHAKAELQSYWIIPAFSTKISVNNLSELQEFANVKLIVEDVPLSFEEPIESQPAPSLSTSVSTQMQLLKVPQLWSRGLTGRGRLVCSFDTGVEVGHPALAGKWRGHTTSLSTSWFSMVEPDSLPNDQVGHGTHTMGIMVGSEGADTVGVAFDAQWITAGVIDQGRPLNSTISDILAAFQWVLNPDGNSNTTDDVPDVILNSWGIPKGLFTPCDQTFWTVIDNVEAAGIVTVFAAGNEGPAAKSMRNPADRATTPTNSFAVGAIDNDKIVASFSGRGPSSCDTTQIKPEVVAPGVQVRSSVKGGGYGYMTGTSMAAPFIAGLVALIRQFNPDATVTQIKNAILLSCEDLGAAGEDNAYGRGLPDASKVLDFIPPPSGALFSIVDEKVTNNFTPLPGDSFSLRLTLSKQSGNVDQITGRLICDNSSQATVLSSHSGFFFGGTGFSATSVPDYQIRFSSNLVHGQQVNFRLELEDGTGAVFDTLYFTLTAGLAPPGTITSQTTSRINFSVSDFGQYGFGAGSIYNTGGLGLQIDGGNNSLYEAGIIVGRSSLLMSSSIRDSLGRLTPTEFRAITPLALAVDPDGGNVVAATMRDTHAQITIPITVIQHTKTYNGSGDGGIIIFEYWLYNHTLENLTSMYFGFFSDIDLNIAGDNARFDPTYQMAWQQNGSGKAVGLVGLKNVSGFSFVTNKTQKIGFTRQQKFNLIATSNYAGVPAAPADVMLVTRSGPFSLVPGDSAKIAFALVIGSNMADLYNNALQARNRYNLSTDIADNGNGNLPSGFVLNQNYPNPFNPTTTISFILDKKQDIQLTVYNLLGQRVKILYTGAASAGAHQIEWDATDDSGKKVSSGVYFYRLNGDAQVASRKMTLLK